MSHRGECVISVTEKSIKQETWQDGINSDAVSLPSISVPVPQQSYWKLKNLQIKYELQHIKGNKSSFKSFAINNRL